MNTPAVGWVITVSATITPDPTGTSEVLVSTEPDGEAVEAGADVELADGVCAELPQPAAVTATAPIPAPTMTVLRGGRVTSGMGILAVGGRLPNVRGHVTSSNCTALRTRARSGGAVTLP
ncbi:hypothetical protein MMAD_29300 [Mycolicibacterium madagascariense]|uniref:Uncharacterized protein n=1 Tax=Mycolicibacterium madagascariense TaxID=212765 RepID=A0A7I7XHS6_9MYCO|nr:hypothetical protein MMAD_29300 [Mycolicibacterium madagascariense]